jgi:ABC-2 type transport system permease protein
MHKVMALIRQDALSRASYRFQVVVSIASLFAMFIPIYFVSTALNPVMEKTIRGQGSSYFAFVLIGMIAMRFCYAMVQALPSAFSSALSSGTLEAMFATPTSLVTIIIGMAGFLLIWTVGESLVVLGAGAALGVRLVSSELLAGLAVLILIVLTYLSIGIFGTALVVLFRTSGGFLTAVVVASDFLGGVYYPTHVIPSWIRSVSQVLPLTYGLRALRRLVLEGAPFGAVSPDLAVLLVFLVVLLPGSLMVLRLSVSHARRTGTLAHY